MPIARVAVIVSARPSWAKLQTVVERLKTDGHVDLDLIACAYALIHRFGRVADVMRGLGCAPTTEIDSAVDGLTLATSVQTMGLTALHVGAHLARTKPDAVVMVADRHETLALSAAASYQNIPLVHLQGGETSGNIDHKVRWANSMLADWHAASTKLAQANLVAAGLPPERVWFTGCPSIDLCRLAKGDGPVTADELPGLGARVDPQQPFTLVMMHPSTEHPEAAMRDIMGALLTATQLGRPMVVFWPGADAGQEEAAKALRMMQPHAIAKSIRMVRTMPPRRFMKLLAMATVAVGNSSALVREATYTATPSVIIGDRQRGRQDTCPAWDDYGDGFAAARVCNLIYRASGAQHAIYAGTSEEGVA